MRASGQPPAVEANVAHEANRRLVAPGSFLEDNDLTLRLGYEHGASGRTGADELVRPFLTGGFDIDFDLHSPDRRRFLCPSALFRWEWLNPAARYFGSGNRRQLLCCREDA